MLLVLMLLVLVLLVLVYIYKYIEKSSITGGFFERESIKNSVSTIIHQGDGLAPELFIRKHIFT